MKSVIQVKQSIMKNFSLLLTLHYWQLMLFLQRDNEFSLTNVEV